MIQYYSVVKMKCPQYYSISYSRCPTGGAVELCKRAEAPSVLSQKCHRSLLLPPPLFFKLISIFCPETTGFKAVFSPQTKQSASKCRIYPIIDVQSISLVLCMLGQDSRPSRSYQMSRKEKKIKCIMLLLKPQQQVN